MNVELFDGFSQSCVHENLINLLVAEFQAAVGIVRSAVSKIDAGAKISGDYGNGQGTFRAQRGVNDRPAVGGVVP